LTAIVAPFAAFSRSNKLLPQVAAQQGDEPLHLPQRHRPIAKRFAFALYGLEEAADGDSHEIVHDAFAIVKAKASVENAPFVPMGFKADEEIAPSDAPLQCSLQSGNPKGHGQLFAA
jgi:hypothetical protein